MIRSLLWTWSIIIASGFVLIAQEKPSGDAFAAEALNRVESKPSIQGDEKGWLFLVRELRHLATGPFWERPWNEVAENQTNPVPSIVEFHELLKQRGKHLVLVPVPAKARIYPDKLDQDYAPEDAGSLTPFVERLREKGLNVVDLDFAFREERSKGRADKLYCSQDAHYSPEAVQKVAALIADQSPVGVEAGRHGGFRMQPHESMVITGDQVIGSEWENSMPSETLSVRPIFTGEERGVTPDADSPFLLIGDSHTLVFHQGVNAGMHCTGAGLLDHLSFQFGRAFDLVGVRGSGMVQARKQLFYRATSESGFWDKKQLVVWVFSEREFTQSTDRPVSIPLDR